MQKPIVMTALAAAILLSACAPTDNESPSDTPGQGGDLASWEGIAAALECTYAEAPLVDEENLQERSICENEDQSMFITVIKAEDPPAAEAFFTTYGQPYIFVSEYWFLVGEMDDLEDAAGKVGSEVLDPGEGTEAGGEGEADPGQEVQSFGEPFLLLTDDSDGNVYEAEVTLTKVECGLKTVENAVRNPAVWDDSSADPYIAAEAPEGKDFCVAYWTQENVGKVPNDFEQAGDIVLGDEVHAKSTEDAQATWTLWEENLGVNYTDPVNPGDSGQTMDMWTVPEGAEATAISFPEVNMVQEEYYLVATK